MMLHRIPIWTLPKAVENLISRYIQFFYHFKEDIYIVDFKLGHNSTISLLYIGKENLLKYLVERIERLFGECIIKKTGTVYMPRIKKQIENYGKNVDLIMVNTDALFVMKGFVRIPSWIGVELDTSRSMEEIMQNFSKGTKHDVNRIKKKNFSFEITTDPEKLEFFYRKMFIPYILKRHGKILSPNYISYVKSILPRTKLMLIKLGGEYIGGALIDGKGHIVSLPCMGIINGEMEYLSQGVPTAINYFHILWAKENGIRVLDFGNSRPFLNDGDFQFKRKWGMRIKRSRYLFDVIHLRVVHFNDSTEKFLENNPFLYFDGESLKGFVYRKKLSPDDLPKLYRQYFTKGMESILISSSNEMEFNEIPNANFSIRTHEKYFDFIDKNLKIFEMSPIEGGKR